MPPVMWVGRLTVRERPAYNARESHKGVEAGMERVLEILSQRETVSGEEMCCALSMTRAGVWKKIESLRQAGWDIRGEGRRGYRLIPGDRLEPVLWRKDLQTRWAGRGICHYQREVTSTNRIARQMALENAPHGSLCLCESQTEGRGRMGRSWVSLPGTGLWQSVIIRPHLRPDQAPLLTYSAALAMARGVEQAGGPEVRIKWPNDLVAGGMKICGILNEVSADPDRIESVVLGVGLNVYRGAVPGELRGQAASLEDFGAPPLRRRILLCYLACLEEEVDRLEREGMAGLREAYRERSCTLGREVRVIGPESFRGTAEDMDETGALLVRREDGLLIRVLAGDVSVRGVMGYV